MSNSDNKKIVGFTAGQFDLAGSGTTTDYLGFSAEL